MRTLVSVQRILNLQPIPDADAIEVATVLGWHVVVKKGEFAVGDLAVYFEIDSLLPMRPEFEFLAKNGTKKTDVHGKIYEGYRLKTVKLRGQISQGLCLPLSILPEHGPKGIYYTEGDDVSDALGVVKYEPILDVSVSGKVKGLFPSFIPKTDEIRIQSMPVLLESLANAGPIYVTEKLDGTSCTVYFRDGEVNVCSRNLNMLDDGRNVHWKAVKSCGIDGWMKEYWLRNFALQGEVMGGNVQGNKLGIPSPTFFLYGVYNISEGKYLSFDSLIELAEQINVCVVPVLMQGAKDYPTTVDEWVEFATRKSTINPQVWAEGVVVRPMKETYEHALGNHLSFKAINPEFLLREK